jgi:integrase
MRVKVKGFKVFKDRFGKERCYHRATGQKVDLSAFKLGTAEFFAECARIAALNTEKSPKPGSLGLLIAEYKKNPAWKELQPKTRKWYDMGFAYLEPIFDMPLKSFTSGLVVRIRDKAQKKKSWYLANIVKTTLSTVFSWGQERDYMEGNPAKGVKRVKRPKDKARANRPWTLKECSIVIGESPAHFRPLIATLRYIGADACDMITFPKDKFTGEAFDFNRQKTGNPVYKPVPKALKLILERAPEHDAETLFANSYGQAWTRSGVDSVWHKLKSRLEEEGKIDKGLTLKGLRHTHATEVRELGESDRIVADALGDKTESMGHHYSRDADVKKNMQRVTKALDRKHQSLTKKS